MTPLAVVRENLQRWIVACGVLVLLLNTTPTASRSASPPVFISVTSDGRVFVLQKDGAIVEVDSSAGKVLQQVYQVPFWHEVLDMDAISLQGTARVCVSIYRRDGDHDRTWLLQWTEREHEIWTTLAEGLFTGVTIDQNSLAVYTTNAVTGEIVQAKLGTRDTHSIATILNTRLLGPMVLDDQKKRLLVADTFESVIYTVNLDNGKPTVLLRLPSSEIRALALDRTRHRLYVADANSEAIWFSDLNRAKPTAEKYSSLPTFKNLSGVAVDGQGRVWVVDQRARKVMKLASDGKSADLSIDW